MYPLRARIAWASGEDCQFISSYAAGRFSALEVIANPQTHESVPSSAGDHSAGTPASRIRLASIGPAEATTTSPDLKRLTRSESESQSVRN